MAENPRRDMVQTALREYPDAPSLTLAKQIYSKAPEMFNDVEHVRSWVRRYRGNHSKANTAALKRSGNADAVREPGVPGDFSLDIPDPIDDWGDSDPIRLRARSVLIIGDIHAPYHDKRALEIAIEAGIKEDVQAVIINGDLVDFWSLSKFLKDPRKREFEKEVKIAGKIIRAIRSAFPGKQIIFKDGNHEERWFAYLYQKAPELLDLPVLQLEALLGLDECKIRRIDKRQHIQIAHLSVMHGHELGRTIWNPVSAARGLFLKAQATALIGHYHRISQHAEKDINDLVIGAWSVGCLCGLRPEYARYNKWQHGFAIVYQDGDYFRVDNREIINGRLV